MKKIILLLLIILIFNVTGCGQIKPYLPEAKNDNIYTTIGGGDETHQGDGYTISVPAKNYPRTESCLPVL